MDKELSDEDFMGRLERAGILKAMVISRNLEGFRDAKDLRHLVCRWCPALHTFLFSFGELTVTLEDVVNNFLLPVLGDENPFNINLSDEDLKVEEKLFTHFGGCTASSSGKQARMGWWVMSLSCEKDKEVRRAGFLAFWLSKFLFSEFPRYGIKSAFFPLAISLAKGAQYPLAPCSWAMFILSWFSFMKMKPRVTLVMQLLLLFVVPSSRYLCGIVLR